MKVTIELAARVKRDMREWEADELPRLLRTMLDLATVDEAANSRVLRLYSALVYMRMNSVDDKFTEDVMALATGVTMELRMWMMLPVDPSEGCHADIFATNAQGLAAAEIAHRRGMPLLAMKWQRGADDIVSAKCGLFSVAIGRDGEVRP